MPAFEASDPDYGSRVHESFARQTFMTTLGARLIRVDPGEVAIEMPFREDLTQQHGFLHAGVVTALVDTACGYAAYSLLPPGYAVLSVEFKINLLAPARGDHILALGRVRRPGRTLTICSGDAFAHSSGSEIHIATMLATIISRQHEGRPDGLLG